MAIQANQALIEGAFKKGQAKASADVVDMKPIFASNKAIGKMMTDTITGIVSYIKEGKKQDRIAREKTLQPFKKIANEAYETLYSQKEPLPQKFVDAVTREVEKLQEEFEAVNTEGKGDTRENERERMRIQGQLKRITNEAINARASFMKIGQNAGNWNEDEIDPDNVGPMQTILDLKNADKNDDYEVDFIDGKLTITVSNYNTAVRSLDPDVDESQLDSNVFRVAPGEEYNFGDPISFNLGQMQGALPTKNPETDAGWMGSITENKENGASDAKKGNVNKWTNPRNVKDAEHAFASTIKTEDQFKDNIRKMDGLGAGFRDDLWNNVDIPISVISNMFLDDNGGTMGASDVFEKLDVVDDDVINHLDYDALAEDSDWGGIKQNIEKIHDALVNTKNPAFSLETSVPLLATYKVNHDIQAYNNSYSASGKNKFKVGNEYVVDGVTYVYQQDGTFLTK